VGSAEGSFINRGGLSGLRSIRHHSDPLAFCAHAHPVFHCVRPGIVAAAAAASAGINTPSVSDARLQLTLFASEPDVVSADWAGGRSRGRAFVLESHTHFPPTRYPGPKSDLVKVLEDSSGDGKAGRITAFAGDLKHAMNLAFSPDGRLYVTHRNGVLRLDDRDEDGASESRATILQMETPGDYPHNGLGGIAFSRDGWLHVGQGENLGERYALKGTDGRVIRGGGEGGMFSGAGLTAANWNKSPRVSGILSVWPLRRLPARGR
jgi:hypothetical protein